MTTLPPVAIALDAPDLGTALSWAEQAGPYVSTVKVGLQAYLAAGAAAVLGARAASGGRAVFLDLKLHDIPNTVAGAARSVARLEPDYLTVHAAGGAAMIRAAVAELPTTRITAVTVLTSLSGPDLERLGLQGSALDVALRWSVLAVEAGARALVCSPQEVAAIRAEVGPDVELVTPGVRPAGSDVADQARTATPAQALADGADLLVVGRPLTAAPDVAAAARELAASLAQS
jgi:orotidine-5'-phosphate decarboxylase